ncbi:TrmH family RNA methyltransferase [Alkalibacillus flavidus]|uniref:TrmH family RNA methyltransferase n=1 Tax=Alkalibacillus flavidus TaxID=546021 RepID=A0ABV2KSP5_9BACI
MIIESKQNERVKQWKKLHKRKNRDADGYLLVEGWHLVEEVFHSNWSIKELIVKEATTLPKEYDDIKQFYVTDAVFRELSQTETNQGIIAVAEKPNYQVDAQTTQKVLCLDGIQDPGNLGTIMRSALAFQIDLIVLGTGTVDPFNDKVIRATQGAIFQVPFVQGDLTDWLTELKKNDIPIWATALDERAQPLPHVSARDQYAIIVGNEGSGVSKTVIDQADETLYIPIAEQSESLNVGVAASIVLYHFQQ